MQTSPGLSSKWKQGLNAKKVSDCFTGIFTNPLYCWTCTLWKSVDIAVRQGGKEHHNSASFWCWLISLASCACAFESFRSKLCQFFKKRGYPDSAVSTGKRRALEIDRETALQTSKIEQTNRILFTCTYHPPNLAVKVVILKNLSLMIPKLNIYFLYHLLFHSNAKKKKRQLSI